MSIGIYSITNILNGQLYIGSSNNIERRWKEHLTLLNNDKHSNPYLQNAWNKYGRLNFKFEILEFTSLLSLDEREDYWLDIYTFLPGLYKERRLYNISKYSKAPLRNVVFSPEHRQKIGEKNSKRFWKDESKRKISLANTGNIYRVGKKHSDISKLKMSKRKLLVKDKLSIAIKGELNPMFGKISPRRISNFILRKDDQLFHFSSIKEAVEITKCSYTTIYNLIKGMRNKKGWEYIPGEL